MRDKLAKLIFDCWLDHVEPNGPAPTAYQYADYLIAHGVTVPQWIPVSEAKPELIPNTAGTAYSDAVNCLTSGRKVITAIWDGTDFIGDAEFWEAEDETITHWCSVLLPLPAEVDNEHR